MGNEQQKTKDELAVGLSIQNIFQAVHEDSRANFADDPDEERINTSQAISRISFYYEKVRNLIDYQEEYLHRKNAIARILKRFIVVEGIIKVDDEETMARNLLIELIRGGYLPNNKIPQAKIGEVAVVLKKYLKLFDELGVKDFVNNITTGVNGDFLMGMMASEVENKLESREASLAVIKSMYEYLSSVIETPEEMNEKKGNVRLQIYLSIYRNFLNFDEDMLNFLLFSFYNPIWKEPTDYDVEKIAKKMGETATLMEEQVNHPLAKQLDKIVGAYTVYYRVLIKIISGNPVGVYKKIKAGTLSFSIAVRSTYKEMYEKAKKKLWNSGTNSILYIFVTKSIFVIALEIPLIKYFGETVSIFPLVVNVFFPAFLMFMVIAATRVTSDENNQRVVDGVEEIVYEEKKRRKPIVLKNATQRSPTITFFFWLLYSLGHILSFGLIVLLLWKIGFNWVSILIFLFFLAFVSFFSIRIRLNVRKLIVVRQNEGLVNFALNFFFMPFVGVGKWLSAKFSQINVFVILMDFFLEAPFKFFLELTEQWTEYVKERKEEMF